MTAMTQLVLLGGGCLNLQNVQMGFLYGLSLLALSSVRDIILKVCNYSQQIIIPNKSHQSSIKVLLNNKFLDAHTKITYFE
jgi:hypothetical protein